MLTKTLPEINWSAKFSLTPPPGWQFTNDLWGPRLRSRDEWEWVIQLPRYEGGGWENEFFLSNQYLEESRRYPTLEAALAGYQEFERPEQYPPQITRSDWKEF